MSGLSKLGLRLALLSALRPAQSSGGPGWPTLARDRFHDSRLDPIDITSRHPEVVISVEVAEATAASSQNAGSPAPIIAEIIFALTVFIEELGEDETPTGDFLVAPSDHDAEDMLDTLEAQILYTTINNAWVRKFAPRFASEVHAEPFRDAETGLKFANRAIRLKAELVPDGASILPAFLAAHPPGEIRDRGAAALSALASTVAHVDGDPLPLEGSDDTFDAHPTPATSGDTSGRIPFTAI